MDFCGDLQNRNLFTTELHQEGGEALIKLSIGPYPLLKDSRIGRNTIRLVKSTIVAIYKKEKKKFACILVSNRHRRKMNYKHSTNG